MGVRYPQVCGVADLRVSDATREGREHGGIDVGRTAFDMLGFCDAFLSRAITDRRPRPCPCASVTRECSSPSPSSSAPWRARRRSNTSPRAVETGGPRLDHSLDSDRFDRPYTHNDDEGAWFGGKSASRSTHLHSWWRRPRGAGAPCGHVLGCDPHHLERASRGRQSAQHADPARWADLPEPPDRRLAQAGRGRCSGSHRRRQARGAQSEQSALARRRRAWPDGGGRRSAASRPCRGFGCRRPTPSCF